MSDENTNESTNESKIPGWFWAVAGVALLWNIFGFLAFIMQLVMTPEMIAALPEAERSLYENFPSWVYIPFGAAVIGGTFGCVLLLMKKALAFELFIVSLVGVLVQNGYSFFMTNAAEVLGTQAIVMPLVVIGIGVGLIMFSSAMKKRGYLS